MFVVFISTSLYSQIDFERVFIDNPNFGTGNISLLPGIPTLNEDIWRRNGRVAIGIPSLNDWTKINSTLFNDFYPFGRFRFLNSNIQIFREVIPNNVDGNKGNAISTFTSQFNHSYVRGLIASSGNTGDPLIIPIVRFSFRVNGDAFIDDNFNSSIPNVQTHLFGGKFSSMLTQNYTNNFDFNGGALVV